MSQSTSTGPYYVLAVSAGGQLGAWGAGVMAGLSSSAGVPEYQWVTGISTGAMLAPLFFVGDYAAAKDLYINLTDSQVYRQRPYLELLTANSLVDNTPLRRRVESIVTEEFINRIRKEALKHRVLAVQSVDLDAGTSVVFDLGALGESDYQPCGSNIFARDCIIHSVMAAAAIPIAFPPEFIHGDMYVDGGVRQHAFSLKLVQATVNHPQSIRNFLSQPSDTAKRNRTVLPLEGATESGARSIKAECSGKYRLRRRPTVHRERIARDRRSGCRSCRRSTCNRKFLSRDERDLGATGQHCPIYICQPSH